MICFHLKTKTRRHLNVINSSPGRWPQAVCEVPVRPVPGLKEEQGAMDSTQWLTPHLLSAKADLQNTGKQPQEFLQGPKPREQPQ